MSRSATVTDVPGRVLARRAAPAPAAYAVFDCETTGTDPAADEIVSLAVVRLDADGVERARYATLVRPAGPIPPEATAVNGIADVDVADAPAFAEIADEVLSLLDGAVFVAHNAEFDLPLLQHGFARAGIAYRPPAVACTLEAYRLLEPLADNHRLQTLCERHGIALTGAHEAMADVLATTELLRLILRRGLAPETVELDHVAYMRLRSRGDTRPASEPQVRRVFGMARSAGLLRPDGGVDRERVTALVERVAGTSEVDSLTRAQVQDVYDALDELIAHREALPPAANA
jgi:DNA polymerase III epsilon subunit family exonuclease